ncbi:MAG: hypothetical protein K5790_03185 [Nitrosopumilus sp.]|uniref:hypothetical protein n=1 Tax=Nitrosopumilus sp. TaxID=2024843 RepID=UPI00247C250E|nr:hypothetical protein [Nitrosopumilus sp.]MCV0392281.1 hypothetical protein [Nitrosopumilus sp.]
MDILIGLVIAMFIITAVYVGFHAADKPAEVGGHHISTELETLDYQTEVIKILKINDLKKSII